MVSTWAVSVILFSAFFGARSDDATEKVRQIVANFNHYLIVHEQTQLELPNIGILPIDPIKLRNGHIGNFSSLEVHEEPIIEEIKNRDGSSTYKFDVKLGLSDLSVKYDFFANFLIYKRQGTFTFATKANEIEATGIVVVQADKSCDATLYSAKYLKYGDHQIIVEPSTFPLLSEFTATLLNYVTPLIIPITNKVIEGTLFIPSFQKHFSDIVCQNMELTSNLTMNHRIMPS
nr:uncharacterized protein LOC106685499 [Halyomorpha halys]